MILSRCLNLRGVPLFGRVCWRRVREVAGSGVARGKGCLERSINIAVAPSRVSFGFLASGQLAFSLQPVLFFGTMRSTALIP